MIPDLSSRAENLPELRDDPNCARKLLFKTYREFSVTNRLLSGWRRCYVNLIRPRLRKGDASTLLDIGFGGGDIPRALVGWARHDGFDLVVTAIDQDDRALSYVATLPRCEGVSFCGASLEELRREKRTFDFVTSNHVLHHISSGELAEFRDHVEGLTVRMAIMNDTVRSAAGYFLFASFAPLVLRNSFSVPDGLVSIRRSFTRDELAAALGPQWRVRSMAWFRLVATFLP